MDESDEESTDLDIESRTLNKLVHNMKKMGFREGAAEGREASFQEGLKIGFSNGFLIGEFLGEIEGKASVMKKLNDSEGSLTDKENDFKNVSNEVCILCQMETENKTSKSEERNSYKLGDIILLQKNHNNEIMTKLKNLNLNKAVSSC